MIAVISILVFCITVSSVSCTCQILTSDPFFIKENDQPGTLLFAATKDQADSITFVVQGPQELGVNLIRTLQLSFRVNGINDTYVVFENNKTLDLEEFYFDYKQVVSLINIDVTCGGNTMPITVAVTPVNNFKPTFNGAPYNISIEESLKVGDEFYSLKDNVFDQDVGMTTNFVFKIANYKIDEIDGRHKFSIKTATLGSISVSAPLDFDHGMRHVYKLNLSVADGTGSGSLTSYTTLTINILDADDQVPYFNFPGCSIPCVAPPFVSVTRLAYQGPLDVSPVKMVGMDNDTLGAVLKYSIATGNDHGLFTINENTAEVTQIKTVNDANLPDAEFRLVIQVYKRDYPDLKSIGILTVKVFERKSNETGLPSPPSGKDTDGADGTKWIIGMVILGLILILFMLACFVLCYLYRRIKKEMAVGPSDDKSEPQTEEEEIDGDDYNSKGFSNEKLVFGNKTTLGIMTDEFPPTPTERANTLPPLPLKDSATETMDTRKKKRSRRRNKNKEPEIFDGTREYNMGMDPEFFEATDKSKVKRSQRSKKVDSSQQINITNDQADVDSGYF